MIIFWEALTPLPRALLMRLKKRDPQFQILSALCQQNPMSLLWYYDYGRSHQLNYKFVCTLIKLQIYPLQVPIKLI